MPSSRSRTLLKAISWETISNTICFALAWWMFGNFGSCLVFTAICIILKIGLFYLHDRIWHQIRYGKQS